MSSVNANSLCMIFPNPSPDPNQSTFAKPKPKHKSYSGVTIMYSAKPQ